MTCKAQVTPRTSNPSSWAQMQIRCVTHDVAMRSIGYADQVAEFQTHKAGS